MRIIWRDYNRTEEDDFKLNVEPFLTSRLEAIELRCSHGDLLGWRIQVRYA